VVRPRPGIGEQSDDNLPTFLTSFVGRDEEVSIVIDLLGRHRLVTIVGSGGVGKTRLAVESGRRLAARFGNGVRVVELAQVDDPELVAQAVATAVHASNSRAASPADAVVSAMRRRHALVVLDNCEHVLGAAAALCEQLLLNCDNVRVLATSREALGVAGEARYPLAGLSIPPHGTDAQSLETYDASALFVERAKLADPAFAVDEVRASAVNDIVRRVDGAPLAIELAAAQVDVVDLPTLAARLETSIDLLVSPGRSPTPRHASISACIDWSYGRLDPAEQRTLMRLSVLPAPWTSAAADALVGGEASAALASLVRRSLLVPPKPGADGLGRYAMLQTVRDYALARLAGSGELDDARRTAALWLTERAIATSRGFDSADHELSAARWMDAEQDSLRDVLGWSLANDRRTAWALAIALAPWWRLRGLYSEGRARLQDLLDTVDDDEALTGWVWLAWLTQIAHEKEPWRECIDSCTRVVERFEDREPAWQLVEALNCLAGVQLNTDEWSAARRSAHRAREHSRQIGYPNGEAFACVVLACVDLYEGKPEDQLRWAQAAYGPPAAIVQGYTDRWRAVVLADALTALDRTGEAEPVYRRLLVECQAIGDRYMSALLSIRLAEICVETGRNDEGRMLVREGVTFFAEVDNLLMLSDAFDVVAVLAAEADLGAAATLQAAAEAGQIRVGSGTNIPTSAWRERLTAELAERCPFEVFTAAHDRGLTMDTADAVGLAFEVLADAAVPPSVGARGGPQSAGRLSPRERELIELVAQGLTDNQIAQRLYISIRTVRSHLDRIRDKTGCRRRAELTRLALGDPS
jgi:predicted ATPase/DNA-binding CsgD family transcriptional regulator